MVRTLKGSIWAVGRIICDFKDLSTDLHLHIANWIQQEIANGEQRFLLMISRGHLKTSFLIALVIWRWINDPLDNALLMHKSSSKASEELRRLQKVLKGDAFQHFFGHLAPMDGKPWPERDGVRWNSNELDLNVDTIKADPHARALGIGSTSTGGHFSTHVFDDLIDHKSSRSAAEIEFAQYFLDTSTPLWCDIRKDVQFVVGTFWPGGFYQHVLKTGLYKPLILGCYADDRYFAFMERMGVEPAVKRGDPIFPEKFDHAALDDEKKKGSYHFSHQYLNIPIQEGLIKFKEEDIVYYHRSLCREKVMIPAGCGGHIALPDQPVNFNIRDLVVNMTIDPASGKKGSDESAVIVAGYSMERAAIFVLHAWSGVVTPMALQNKIFELYQKYKPTYVGVEDVALQSIFTNWLRQEQIARKIFFTVVALKVGGRSKHERIIDGFQPYVENRQVYFLAKQKKLIQELLDLKFVNGQVSGRSPNLVDALAYHVDLFRYSPRYVQVMDDVIEERDEDDYEEVEYGMKCETF